MGCAVHKPCYTRYYIMNNTLFMSISGTDVMFMSILMLSSCLISLFVTLYYDTTFTFINIRNEKQIYRYIYMKYDVYINA